MTPLEINKKIAEAMGCIVLTHPDGTIYEGGDGLVRKYKNARFPNWAESISDVWELFDEMEESKLRNDCNGQYKNYSCEFVTKWGGDEYGAVPLEFQTVQAETAPLAICKAWLKWKIGEL